MIIKWLAALLFTSLLLGQLGGVSINSEITVYAHDLVMTFFLIVSLILLSGKRWRKPELAGAITAFILVSVISLLINSLRFSPTELLTSALYLARWTLYAVIYAVVLQGIVASSVWLWGLYLFGSALAALGLIQYVWYPDLRNLYYLGWDPHFKRVFSALLDPNFASIIFVFTVFLGVYLWTRVKRHLLILVFQFINLLALALTYSRSGYLAFLVGIAIGLASRKRWKWGVLAGIIFLGSLLFLPRPGGEGVKLLRTSSALARVGNWQRGIELISRAPFWGHGFNTLRYLQQDRGRSEDGENVSKAGAGLDSSLQFIWATTGIVGLAAYVWLLLKMASFAWRRVRRKSDQRLQRVYLASLGSLMVHSLFINSLFYPWVLLWLWILTAVAEKTISDR